MYLFNGYNFKSTNSIYLGHLGHQITVTFLLLMQLTKTKVKKTYETFIFMDKSTLQ